MSGDRGVRGLRAQVRPTVSAADVAFHEEWNRKHGALAPAEEAACEDGEDDGW